MVPCLLFSVVLAYCLVIVNAIATISTKGSKFFTSDGNQFFVKGVAYQLVSTGQYTDPLVNSTQCAMDAALMKQLGANTIRVYHVRAAENHDACMTIFANAGIYLFVDLDDYPTAITEAAPMWTQAQLSGFEAVMDAFQGYSNTAGFFIGNEILNDDAASNVAPFIKSAVRDMKAYRSRKGYRAIPIGYSHADIIQLRPNLQDYLVCGDAADSIDFFGLNAYEFCGVNNFAQSGYEALTSFIKSYPVPYFFSETGCNHPLPRLFQDQAVIFGPQMSPYWSGAIIYEWIQETNHFGLVTYNADDSDDLDLATPAGGFAIMGAPTPVVPEFANLLSAWATAIPASTAEGAYTPAVATPACPAYTPGVWLVNGNVALPTLGESLNAAVATAFQGGVGAAAAVSSTAAVSLSSVQASASSVASVQSASRSSQSSAVAAASSSFVAAPVVASSVSSLSVVMAATSSLATSTAAVMATSTSNMARPSATVAAAPLPSTTHNAAAGLPTAITGTGVFGAVAGLVLWLRVL